MAEQPSKPTAKRRLKPVQTVREQAEAAREPKAKRQAPTGVKSFFYGFTWPLRKLGRGIAWLSKYIVPPYFRNSAKELRLVTWPDRKQSRQLTFAVMIFAVIFGLLVAGVDYGLDKLFKRIILHS